MFTARKEKSGLSAWYSLCPVRHALILIGAAAIALHWLTRPFHALNVFLSAHLVQPAHRWLSLQCAGVSFSVAELLIGLLTVFLPVYLIWQIYALFHRPQVLLRLYRTVCTLLALALSIYGGFCLLWGVYYYGDDFMSRSGLPHDPVSVQQLETVTAWFADLANEYSGQVPRNEIGRYATDRRALIDKSPEVYRAVEEQIPALAGPERKVKAVTCSRVMSYVDFTGFFFPFTGEANVNTDFPPALFASTIAHELAHQRGVAKEQEANFAAVLACLAYGDPEYVYSAALLAYTHLGNALYSADRAAWEPIYAGLNDAVKTDFSVNRTYWAQFETPVQTASNKVYESFLQSYDQTLGLKSYGACVDLLVNYYYPLILAQQAAEEEASGRESEPQPGGEAPPMTDPGEPESVPESGEAAGEADPAPAVSPLPSEFPKTENNP